MATVLETSTPAPTARRASSKRRKISMRRRIEVEKRNRALLEEDLLSKSFVFRSRPYEAHLQFSNVCNMSCVMCYDGWIPPVRRISPDILRKVTEELAPNLSVMIPYGGSEPLIVTWDQARDLAEQQSVQIRLTTNVQFLDAQKFEEAKGITETLFVSIDSHIPEVFEKIRPGSKPDRVFENLALTARLSKQNGLECLAQIVFMTENAAQLPETLAYLADVGIESVNVLQMLDVNGRSGYLDPLLHFSSDYVEWIKHKCVEITKEKGTRLIWNAGGYERHDFRREKVPPKIRKDWNHRWEHRMKRHLPGYCVNVFNRVQIDADGTVTPCAYATDDDLVLGQMSDSPLDEIWNSPNAQDLRRAMLTRDLPSLCKTCMYTDLAAPEIYLPFAGEVPGHLGRLRQSVACTLAVEAPAHMTRTEHAPTFSVSPPRESVERWFLGLALGGEAENLELHELTATLRADEGVELELPDGAWSGLRTNLGYWWAVFGLSAERPGRTLRSSDIRCLIRHEPIRRIEGSDLRYPDLGHLAVVDLGGRKEAGWTDTHAPQSRPRLGERRTNAWKSSRLTRDRGADGDGARPMSRAEYAQLVGRVCKVVDRALPAESTVLVTSKGDDALLQFDCREAWHFPCGEDGLWAGFHPADGEWAIEHLEALRACGADYLVMPATSTWWLERYPELADHLTFHYPVVCDDDACVIFALGPYPAFYGRKRDAEVNGYLASTPQPVIE
jgi:radical SAM protein with 4Fe4S-binding SPASM domain